MGGRPAIEVRSHGLASSIRDAGRVGLAHLGCSRGGAVDRAALHLANRLVGNPPDAAAWETSGGLTITTSVPIVVAVAGSPADLHVDGGPLLGWGHAQSLPAGATVGIGRLRGGARTYLAVRGGLSTIEGSDHLAIGPDPVRPPAHHHAVPRPLDGPVRIWPGPRLDWFAADGWELLLGGEWTVRSESDRIGARLAGPAIARRRTDELPSEGLVEGAIQVPPDGRPIVMLADHPTTGGYPVIAVVDPEDIGLVAQRPPGSTLRFTRARRR